MKKIKLVLATLLASTLGLAACGDDKKPEPSPDPGPVVVDPTVKSVKVTGSTSVYATKTVQLKATVQTTGDASKEVTWSSSNDSIATVSSTGLVTGVAQGKVKITATSVFDTTKSGYLEVIVGPAPAISSVVINSEDCMLNLNEEFEIDYTVNSVSEASEEVTWASSNPQVASVDDGVVTALAVGKTTITVTSVFDTTKSDSIEIEVADMGFSKELYLAGYTFTRDSVASIIKKFIGEGEYEVYEAPTEITKTGVYYMEHPEDDKNYASFSLVLDIDGYDESAEEKYEMLLDDLDSNTNLFGFYDPYYWMSAYINVGQNYLMAESIAADDDYTYYYCALDFYKVSDLYEGSTKATEDTDFSVQDKAKLEELFGDIEIPFPVLGEDYKIDIDEEHGEVYIDDYCSNYNFLDTYAQKLESNGFKYSKTDGAYVKTITGTLKAVYVSLSFTIGYGNDIYYSVGPAILDAFPTEAATNYISSEIGSKFPALPIEVEGAEYRYNVTETEDGNEMYISCIPVKEEQAEAYLTSYLEAGYELVAFYDFDEETGCETAIFAKGKLAVMVQVYPEMVYVGDDVSYNFDNSSVTVEYAVYDEEASEEKGIYLSIDEAEVTTEDIYIVTPQVIDLDGAELKFASSDEDIATVDEDGFVLFNDEGDVTITVSTEVETVPYSASITFHVTKVVAPGVTFDFSKLTTTSGEIDGYAFASAKGSGQSAPAYNTNKEELRLYASNTITFTSEESMVSIFFDANTCGESKATASFISASTGTVSTVDGGFLWEGDATEVTLIVSASGQIHINAIVINGGGSGGGGEVAPEIDENILNAAKAVFVNVFGEEPSSIGDYDNEDSEADMYTCKHEALEFAGFFSYEEVEDESIYAEIYESLVDALPEGSVIYDGYEGEIDEEYGFYDVWYINDGLIYAVYVSDYYGYYVTYSVDVFEEEEAEDYKAYVYQEDVEE